MKTIVLIGLLAIGAIVAPVAAAHFVVSEEQADGTCKTTTVGDPSLPPHGAAYTGDCRAYHGWVLP